MIAAFDVHYSKTTATAAVGVFENYASECLKNSYVAATKISGDYQPGQFYLRELPCIKNLLQIIEEDVSTILVDGYVHFDGKPGLGQHLFEELQAAIPVIGVAKSKFKDSAAEQVLRGNSRNPLYVTSAGVATSVAAEHIKSMHGPYRIPTLLKAVDRLCREQSA